jgi:hypothetical protein
VPEIADIAGLAQLNDHRPGSLGGGRGCGQREGQCRREESSRVRIPRVVVLCCWACLPSSFTGMCRQWRERGDMDVDHRTMNHWRSATAVGMSPWIGTQSRRGADVTRASCYLS